MLTGELQSQAVNAGVRFPSEKWVLDNGLTVILAPDASVPMVSYHTWYKVGSRNESAGVTGAAHMLEHMMFKGAKKYSGKQFDQLLHQNGITNNAFTSWDYTGFYQNLPSHKLDLMMDMEVDRMQDLAILQSDLDSELKVVMEERGWRIDNSPMGMLREALFSQIFVKTPYSWPVIGHREDILAYTSEKLRFFYQNYYVPNNAILVLAGDFDASVVKKQIEKLYGSLKPKEVPVTHFPKMEIHSKSRRQVLKKDVQTSTFILAYPSVDVRDSRNYALDILANILGSGVSSRLPKSLVYEKELASSAGAFQLSNMDSGLFGISVSVRPDQDWMKVEAQVRKDLAAFMKSGPTERELEKAKNRTMKDYVDGMMTLDAKARALATSEILFGEHDRFFEDLERYQQVTVAQVTQVAKEILKESQEVLVALVPEKKKAKTP